MDLLFDAKGGVDVLVTTRVASEGGFKNDPVARQRVVDAREAVRCGEDAFTRQIERLSPFTFRRTVTWRNGELSEVSRAARFDEPRAVERLFEGAPLSVSVFRREQAMQLEIVPGTGGRATPAERRDVAAAVARVSEAGSAYLRALGALWRHLDESPGRERPFLAWIAGVEKRDRPEGETEDEKKLIDAVEQAFDAVRDFSKYEEGQGDSLEELSRRVYDPFPAPLAVEVAGRVEEETGFVPEGARRHVVRPVSLQGTLLKLSERWVSPDLMPIILADEKDRPSLDELLAKKRVVRGAPSPAELRDELERALAPEPVYRLRWTLPAAR